MLEEQRKRIEESEECFKTDRKQLEKQFTLQEVYKMKIFLNAERRQNK